MRPALITFIIMAMGALILWIAADVSIGHLAQLFPFVGGFEFGPTDIGGLAMILITLWGLRRLYRNASDSSSGTSGGGGVTFDDDFGGDDE